MLSTGLSLNNSIKRLERVFKSPFHSIGNIVIEARNYLAPAQTEKIAYQTPKCKESTSLKISRTVLPDERLDYSQTFQHIRHGLEEFYKEHYHNFSNYTTPPHQPGELRITEKIPKTSTQINSHLVDYPSEGKTLLQTTILPTGIAKTVLPDESRDFNETFLHIRAGLDRFYKEKNPLFTNTAFTGEAKGQNEEKKGEFTEIIRNHFKDNPPLETASFETLTNKPTPGNLQFATEDQITFGNSFLYGVDKILATESAFLAEEAQVESPALAAIFIAQPTLGAEVIYTYTSEDVNNYKKTLIEIQPSGFQYSLSCNYSSDVNTSLLAETNITDEPNLAKDTAHPFQQPITHNPENPSCTRISLRAPKEQGRQKKDCAAHPPHLLYTHKDHLKGKNRLYNAPPSLAC